MKENIPRESHLSEGYLIFGMSFSIALVSKESANSCFLLQESAPSQYFQYFLFLNMKNS